MAAVAAAAAAPPARSWSASTGPVPPSSPASSKKGGLSYLGEVWIMLRWTWPLLLGNTLEWYEFGVYGYVEAEISDNFFGGSQEGGWLGFAVTFVARPVGGFLLGWVADRWSRKLAVNLSLAGMIVATVGQGLLPGEHLGRDLKGLGLVGLVFCRALQGLSVGGEIGAISSWLMEASPLASVGMAVSMISVGSQVAWAFTSCFLAVLSSAVGPEAMLVWGWRVPFLLAIIPGATAMWGRNNMVDTEALNGEEPPCTGRAHPGADEPGPAWSEAAPRASPCCGLLDCWPSVLIGFGGSLGIATMWFTASMWPLTAILDPYLGSASLWVGFTTQVVGLAVTPVAGWLTDKSGVGFVTFTGAGFFALIGLPIYVAIASDPSYAPVAFLGVGLFYGLAQGFAGATIYLFVGELFPRSVRCRGIAASYNVALTLGGGFGSSICQALLGVAPEYGPGLFFSATGLLSAVTVLVAVVLQRRGLVQLCHRRPAPYFGPAEVQGH